MSAVALVTGGAGFIGAHIVTALLQQGRTVRVLDNLSTGYRENLPSDVDFVHADIRDADSVHRAAVGCEVIYHVAAAVGNTRSIESPIVDALTNLVGTLHVLQAARAAGCAKVVYSSSAAIFGEPLRVPIDEDHPTRPMSPYGVSKLAGEHDVLVYARLYGFVGICLRYFNVFGALQRYDPYGNVIPIFARNIGSHQRVLIYGDGNQTRDFVDVRDVAQANVLAATDGVLSGCFNIGSGRAVRIRELAERMFEICGQPERIEHTAPRAGDVRHSVADIAAARARLGYVPRYELEASLRRYMEWVSDQR